MICSGNLDSLAVLAALWHMLSVRIHDYGFNSDGGATRRPCLGLKKSSSSSGKPEDLLVYVEWLRQQAEEFQRNLEEELRLTSAQLLEERVRQAKRRGP